MGPWRVAVYGQYQGVNHSHSMLRDDLKHSLCHDTWVRIRNFGLSFVDRPVLHPGRAPTKHHFPEEKYADRWGRRHLVDDHRSEIWHISFLAQEYLQYSQRHVT